jgi:hypothetical protein
MVLTPRVEHSFIRVLTLVLIVLLCSTNLSGYSVLTHEEIVDLLWTDGIRPLLLQRYPESSDEQLQEAHAYAYGGAVIQDLGYYPFGSAEFSDLTHYVRSGDFVRELRLQSQDVNEYAFALGALSHYASDIAGRPGEMQSIYFFERASQDVWRYYSITRTGANASKLAGGHAASSINRAVAFYRHMAAIPTDQEPPASP